jgi:hypothetical protein
MRIECTDGDGVAGNEVNVKEEPPELQAISESSPDTTPVEEETKPMPKTVEEEANKPTSKPVTVLSKTRGVKVRYTFDEAAASGEGDDDFLPGNTKKKRRTASRHAKVELPDIGGYRPSRKKKINRKDPNRCHVCRQR